MQGDLLSIECFKTLNEALQLHHERSKCNVRSPPTISNQDSSETTISRKFGKFEEVHNLTYNTTTTNNSEEISPPEEPNQTFSSMRFWIISLWAFSILGFVIIMSVMLSGRKGQKKRGKVYKPKRRSSYSGFWDTNGHDRHLRSGEMS